MDTTNLISEAIEIVGLQPLAKACGRSYQALRKWERKGRLPRTEWTGETNYAEVIERETSAKGRPITKEQLLGKQRKRKASPPGASPSASAQL